MPRYIDADEAIDEINRWIDTVGIATVGKGLSYYAELLGCIEDTPTADVQELRRGFWFSKKNGDLYCSRCGNEPHIGKKEYDGFFEFYLEKYCPHCGSKNKDLLHDWRE